MPSTMPFYTTAGERRLTDVLAWEQEGQRSREVVTVRGGASGARDIQVGMVLGCRLFGTPVITPGSGNGGAGTLGALTLGPAVRVGTYEAVCIEEDVGGGVFAVFDPDGRRMRDAVAGAAYETADLTFTITASGADFDEGDSFAIEIPAGDGKVGLIDFAATGGEARAYAVAASRVHAPEGVDQRGLAIRREATIIDAGLIWPDGATNDQKAAAAAQLAERGLLLREGI